MTPTLDALAMSVVQWQRNTFPAATVSGAMVHLQEEVDELLEASRSHLDLAPEIADVFFLLLQVAASGKVDLAEAVAKKLELNRRRKWQAPDARNVVRHVEGT